MIRISKDEGLKMQGKLSEVSAQAILIMKEIYKKNEELYGQNDAIKKVINVVMKAIVPEDKWDEVQKMGELLDEEGIEG